MKRWVWRESKSWCSKTQISYNVKITRFEFSNNRARWKQCRRSMQCRGLIPFFQCDDDFWGSSIGVFASLINRRWNRNRFLHLESIAYEKRFIVDVIFDTTSTNRVVSAEISFLEICILKISNDFSNKISNFFNFYRVVVHFNHNSLIIKSS